MDGFSYINLFDTKGIEYIIIIAFLILIIPFWRMLNRPLRVNSGMKKAVLQGSLLKAPQGIFLSNNHTWAHMLRSGDARIGINNLLINLTGDVNIKMVRDPGTRIRKGEVITELERGGKRLAVVSPVSGEITGSNPDLESDPSLLREDPYGGGWICSIRPTDWLGDISGFHFAAEANTWLKNEMERIRDFMAVAAHKYTPVTQAVYMQDGGEPAGFPLAAMPEEAWQEFQNEFLK
ncbi:MAG: glycine cleavage system protein H [Bacteroidales bacterium]|nr:glycine cleavage system protein H [Bacteroidales bacterium]MDT8372757.1 glycine cleavage system protein H [Bacteroidales bacterium]